MRIADYMLTTRANGEKINFIIMIAKELITILQTLPPELTAVAERFLDSEAKKL